MVTFVLFSFVVIDTLRCSSALSHGCSAQRVKCAAAMPLPESVFCARRRGRSIGQPQCGGKGPRRSLKELTLWATLWLGLNHQEQAMLFGAPRQARNQEHRGGLAPASVWAGDAGVSLWK